MSKGTFGDRLKRERELRGVSLDEVSAATRISNRYLLALENERWEELPGGVFNRGFVRSVARYLGLNEEDLVTEYAEITGEHGASLPRSAMRVGVAQPPGSGHRGAGVQSLGSVEPKSRSGLWVGLSVAALLAAGSWYGWHRFGRQSTTALSPPQEVQPARPPSIPTPEPQAANAAEKRGERPLVSETTKPKTETLRLKVEAGRATALRVLADGRALYDGELVAGRTVEFEARDRIEVSVGDSAAVLLELNGQTLPPLGTPGQPGRTTLTRKDLKQQ